VGTEKDSLEILVKQAGKVIKRPEPEPEIKEQ